MLSDRGSTPLSSTIKVKDPQPLWLRAFLVFVRVCVFFASKKYARQCEYFWFVQQKNAMIFETRFDTKEPAPYGADSFIPHTTTPFLS